MDLSVIEINLACARGRAECEGTASFLVDVQFAV